MTEEKWDQMCEMLEDKYPDLERYRENLEGEHGGMQEVLEFEGPAGPMRVVRTSKPAVTGVEHHYSHRQGATANTEYKYSDSELTHKIKVYRDVGGDWEEMDASSLGF